MAYSDSLFYAIDSYLANAPAEFKGRIMYNIAPLNSPIVYDHHRQRYSLVRLLTDSGHSSYVELKVAGKDSMDISHDVYVAWIRRNASDNLNSLLEN
jgi:hypothetical protein